MSRKWAEFLLVIAVVAQFFCGTASVTSASRMMFAFSRDGAIPGHRWWSQVNRSRVPMYSVIAIVVLSWALMIPTYWNNATGYLVGTSIAVIGLYIAFALPIILRWRAGESFERGPWNLGKHYKWIDALAVAWIALICVLFLMPVTPTGIPWKSGFNWNVVNYAPLTVGGALLLFGGWYIISAHKWFKGPVRQGSDEELGRIEAGLDAGSLGHQPAQA
jgi:amino acid transporter